MGFLYILQSETTAKFYVGSTNDLARRGSEHDRGHCPATRGRGPWKLFHTEQFSTLQEARHRKLEVKRWKTSKMIHALISSSVG